MVLLTSVHWRMSGAWQLVLCAGFVLLCYSTPSACANAPSPKPWPTRFHALLVQNMSGELGVMDLWYDWGKGGNLHIIQNQLVSEYYDMEWTNGTSFFYDLEAKTCRTIYTGVGILRPDWLDHANYLGVKEVDGFTCNVWEKADFITYYEDVESQRPVFWVFYTGRQVHVITFEVGAKLQEKIWQAPAYCFTGEKTTGSDTALFHRYSKFQSEYKDLVLSMSGAVSA